VLRVLQEGDYEEGDDGRRRVDHELPRVHAREQPERTVPTAQRAGRTQRRTVPD
jgi:hypothetical protein